MLLEMIKSVVSAAAGLAAAKVTMNMISKNQVSAKDEYKWDYNWDKRHPTAEWTDDEKLKYRFVDFTFQNGCCLGLFFVKKISQRAQQTLKLDDS